jgi:hypothetical protein
MYEQGNQPKYVKDVIKYYKVALINFILSIIYIYIYTRH